MSKRIAGIAILFALFANSAHAEARKVLIGDSGWEFFRPEAREQTPFDLTYLTYHLRSDLAGLGLRFKSSPQLTLDLEINPFTDRQDLIGPVYDMRIGATTLALRFSF